MRCKSVCAFQNGYVNNGDEPTAYALRNKDDNVVFNSSSGGAFYAIATTVINEGGVVFGCCMDDSLNVVHSFTNAIEGLNRFQGSKYVSSNLGNCFELIQDKLVSSHKVLFTGTPCQCAAIRNLVGDNKNLITVDFACHGVSSPEVFRSYINYLEDIYNKKIIGYKWRTKDKGWMGYLHKANFFDNSFVFNTKEMQDYKKVFFLDFVLRECCASCPFTNFKRPSDITMCDFWGVERYFPMLADNKGASCVLINTTLGADIFNSLKNSITYFQCDKNMPNCERLYEPSKRNPRSKEFIQAWLNSGYAYAVSRFIKTDGIIMRLLKIMRLKIIVVKGKLMYLKYKWMNVSK
jgi:coenzyme F420-reducing hydrogenase beta subunit